MYICFAGGVHNGEYVPWLYCYDPVMDVWARKQDMNTKRAIHTLAVMNDRLYAIGGNHLKGHIFNREKAFQCPPSLDKEYLCQTVIVRYIIKQATQFNRTLEPAILKKYFMQIILKL